MIGPAPTADALFRLAGVGVVQTDLTTGRFMRVSQAFCGMVGYTETELLGMTYLELTHPDDRARDAKAFQALQRGERHGGSSLTRVVRRDCETVWLELHVTVLSEGDGAVNLAVATDVTERQRAMEALHQSEARYRALVTASADVVYRMSADWTEMHSLVGKAFIPDTDDPSKSWLELYIHPDDQAHVLGMIDEAVRTKSVFEVEHRVVRVDGSLGWTFSRALPLLDAAGDVSSWLGTARDVTARKRSEEALRESEERLTLALGAARMGEWSLDLTTGEATHSPLHDRIFGYEEPLSEWTYEAFLDHVHPDDRAFVTRAFERSRRTGDDWEFECRIIRADGDARWIWASGSSRGAGASGEGGRMYGLVNDVTERKHREANAAFLAEVSQELAHLTNIDDTMNALGEQIAGYFGLSACAFVELTEDAQVGVIDHGWHRADTPSLLGTYRMEAFMTEEVIQSCRAGEAVVIRDVFADSRTDGEGYAALNIGSFVSMPLVRGGEWRFLLVVYRSEPHNWQGDEIDLLRELADRIWTRLERARAEAEVRESEARLQLVIESAQGYAIFTLAEDGTVSSWNEGAAGIFGWDDREIVGQHARVLYTPEDRVAGELQRELDTARAKGSALDRRWHLRNDGSRVYLDGLVQPLFDPAGQLSGFVKIGRDLTAQHVAERERERLMGELEDLNETLEHRVIERTEALRHSEQRFSQAFFSNPIPACMTTFGRETFVEVNEAFLNLAGYAREEVVGKTALELGMWSSNDNQRRVNTALAQESRFRELDLQVRVKGGGVRDVLLSAEVIRLDGHDGYLKMFYDVTERKRTEEQLHEAVQQVMTDASWFSRKLMEQLAHIRSGGLGEPEIVELSKRERQVLERMAKGLSNDAIAGELGLAEQTVRNYISNLYDKLGVHSRTEAVVWARERGIVGP